MANNLLEQLADQAVPQRPPDFDRQLHERINSRLLVMHLGELLVATLPYAFFHFLQALTGAMAWSLTGRFFFKGADDAKRSDENDD